MRTAFVRIALVLLVSALAAAGCGKKKTVYKYEDTLPNGINEIPKTALRYERVSTIDANVGQLRGIDVDARDRLYMVGSGGLHVLDAEGNELGRMAVPKSAASVSVADDGTIYVGCRQQVLRFSADGKRLGNLGAPGVGPGKFSHVTSVVVHGSDVLVADADAKQMFIHRFATDGTFLNDIGRHAEDKTQFLGLVLPSPFLDCVVDDEGNVVVTNTGRLRVEVYSKNGGRPLRHWGIGGLAPDAFSGCCNPTNLAITRDGLVVTAEKGMFGRVKIHDRRGNLLAYIPPSTFPGKPRGMDLAVDSKNRIYVAYTVKSTVMVFERRRAKE